MNSRLANLIFIPLLVAMIVADYRFEIPWWAYFGWVIIYLALNIRGSLMLSSQFFLPARCNGVPESKSIAITFDDGPEPKHTSDILKILKEHHAKATFFCIGEKVKAQPELVKRIHDDGHLVGNHSYFHGALFDLQTAGSMAKELTDTNAAIRAAIGQQPRFFRPPYGVSNPMLSEAVAKVKQVTVGWSVRSFDTVATDKEALLNKVTAGLKGGDIILFHDRCEVTKAILPDLFRYVKKAGLKIESLDTILGESAYE